MTVASALFNYPKFHAQTALGIPLIGGKVYTYAPGTTTPKAAYSDEAMTSAHTNPIVLNSNGDATIYLNGLYDIVLKDSTDVTQWSFSGARGIKDYTNYEVDVLNDYGNGTAYTQASIAAALTAVGTSTKKTLLLQSGTWTITSDADWSAYTSVVLKFAPGAVLQIATGKTLTWGGLVEAAKQQIFSLVGTGNTVLSAITNPDPFWWGGASAIATLANDATPSIAKGCKWLTGGTTTITDFDDGVEGQEILIIAEHSITITDGTNIFLSASGNFVMSATDTLRLVCKADGKWYEIGRSDNT